MIGIDVAKQTLAVCRWDQGEAAPSWERSYPNNEAGVRQLLADTPGGMAWVVEATGRYAELAVAAGQQAGREVRQAHTLAAKRYLQSLNPRAKTDKVDARGLALYGQQASLRSYQLKDPELAQLWELLQMRRGLAESLARLRQQIQVMPAAAELGRCTAKDFQARIGAFDKAIMKAGRKLDLFARLDAIPGIGTLTAAALTVRLLSIDFPSYDSFVAYLGLDLRVWDSGKKRGQRHLTKQGDAQLRCLLYLAAQSTLRKKQDLGFQELFKRKHAEGWPKTASLCMVARKMAKVAWSLARSGEHYDPARVFAARPGLSAPAS